MKGNRAIAMTAFRGLACIAALGSVAAGGLAWWDWVNPVRGHVAYGFSETYFRKTAAANSAEERVRWAREATVVAPNRAENWVLLASAYKVADGKVSARAISALRQSYRVSALSPDAAEWRLAYIFKCWPDMPRDLREAAKVEVSVNLKSRVDGVFFSELEDGLTDVNARMTLGLLIRQHQNLEEGRRGQTKG